MRTRRLIVTTPEGERELLFVGRLRVGRAPDCDISLVDSKASRYHAEFDASGPLPRVTDLGSRNGILVNGHKVASAELAPGDVVTVGDARIRLVEQVPAPAPASAAATPGDERTAVLAGPPAAVNPVADPPAGARERASGDDSTAVLPPPQTPADREAPVPAPAPPSDERTVVLPRPSAPAASDPAASPALAGAADASAGDGSAPPASAADSRTPGSPAGVAAPPRAAAPAPAPARDAASDPASPAVVDARPQGPPVREGGAVPANLALTGPRVSWGGLVTLTAVLLGGLAVLLGSLPVLSVASGSVDALSRRQARTLAGWLAAGVDPQASPVVDARVLDDLLGQPGVERAVVLDRATGRAIAPTSMSGQHFSTLPGIGTAWRSVTDPQVGVNETFVDAYVSAPAGGHVVWVRYRGAPTSDAGFAVVVALVASLVFAILGSLMITRHTRATLQQFTRQVELAVSGASPKVMQGTLMPGLERLPGVVTYLIEQRKAGIAAGAAQDAMRAAGPAGATAEPGGPGSRPIAVSGPPWLEVTTALAVVDRSVHGPASGASAWTSAAGRHLLDVLDSGEIRNAVVQGLGALGMQAGAETTVPAPGVGPVSLQRQPSGHVRVTLGTR